ncbi:MAG: hypothetical protein AVDCRST_MAG68-5554 [uncultured Gemmatimonadetes bacterium]|uniref:Uncharacterized protein n=1 Tax=uncultured Gemmatimonadota bacterium TaxID=203437 RepID=A0A6J4MWU6_9BACT|nr:MAG: hypothetical protein AVDCRST_MAG68-5554 [uncultured Gemmatimonadota bacterium]
MRGPSPSRPPSPKPLGEGGDFHGATRRGEALTPRPPLPITGEGAHSSRLRVAAAVGGAAGAGARRAADARGREGQGVAGGGAPGGRWSGWKHGEGAEAGSRGTGASTSQLRQGECHGQRRGAVPMKGTVRRAESVAHGRGGHDESRPQRVRSRHVGQTQKMRPLSRAVCGGGGRGEGASSSRGCVEIAPSLDNERRSLSCYRERGSGGEGPC